MRRRTIIQTVLCTTIAGCASHPFEVLAQDLADLPDEQADIVVIGGGAAGLSAAVSAAQAANDRQRSLRIVLLEKNSSLGGDTSISGGYFNAVDPKRQMHYQIEDSVDLFKEQILEAAGPHCDPALVERLATEATDALEWLESLGMRFLPQIDEIFGSPYPRAHKPVLARGTGYIRALTQAAMRADIDIKCSAQALSLLTESGVIRGVAYKTNQGKRFCATSCVILASGGYGANRTLIKKFAPNLAELPVDTQPGSTGDMLIAAQKIGADLVNLSFIECTPGAGSEVPYPLRLDFIPARMIFVGDDGLRFVDETSSRADIATAIAAQQSHSVWAVADQGLVSDLDVSFQKNLYRGFYAGIALRANTTQDLAQQMGVPVQAFSTTLASNPAKQRIHQPPFWAVPVHLRIHSTLGGIRINDKAEVLNVRGSPFPYLWAAGAVTGGIHGRNRIGGNGINTAVVFGRIAGKQAANVALT